MRTMELHPVTRQLICLFADFVNAFGLPPSIGEIFGYIFSSPEPVTFEAVIADLAISRGSASQGLRFLRNINAIKVHRSAQGRRSLYTPQTSLRHLVSGVLAETLQPKLLQSAEQLETIEALATMHADIHPTLHQRVRLLRNWSGHTRRLMPVIQRFAMPKAPPSKP